MCGFAGIIAWEDRYRTSAEVLGAMSARIAHRGPDGAGEWISDSGLVTHDHPQAALAHRRLAIIDPDPRANQPFADERGRQLVFNGEIYNFRALKAEITALRPDFPWRTACDTEVLLAAYAVWGEECCERLEGMFALAIWDPAAGSVLLARDRMGQKPLYLAVGPGVEAGGIGAIAFASELPALRAVPWVDATIDFSAVGHYLRWGYIPAPLTIYRGCEKLPPARWMRVRAQGLHVEQYFDPNRPPVTVLPEAPTAAGVRERVTAAVARQLVSDVPLGCFLSGGIDSSIVAAAMTSAVGESGGEVSTFSIGFDDPRYDETRHAAEVARHLGTMHRQFTVRPNAAEDLPKLAAVFGEPFGDSSALPTHYLARETREHVKVALSGDGGDELFGGYDRYRAMWLGEGFRKLPAPLQRIATSRMWEHLPGTHPKSSGARLKRMLASLHLLPAERYDAYMRLFDEETARALCPQDDAVGVSRWLAHEYAAQADGLDAVQAAMALDRVTYLPDDLLAKVDRASMLHALEVRSPFMDHGLVHFAAQLSTESLLGAAGGAKSFMQSPMNAPAKRLLREAFADDLPASVFTRPKMGFAVPIGDWLRGALRPLLHDAVDASDSFTAQYLDVATIGRLMEAHEAATADHSQRLYALLMLELWWAGERGY